MLGSLTSGRTLRQILISVSLTAFSPLAAHAEDLGAMPMALASSAGAACSQTFAASTALAPVSKASILLGGAPSALERIRMEQEAGPVVLAASAVRPVGLELQSALAPAAAPPLQTASCLQWAAPKMAIAPALQRATGSPGDILASKRLAIRHTMFDAAWARVSGERLSRARYTRVLGAVPQAPEQALARVNAWVNRNIAYVEDRTLFGRADYWAGASRTLKLREGDCEDIALTKMQLLAAAGVPREDMILTIARDLVRGADHAVLMVKQGDRFVMLDNATDTVLDATGANDYRPVLSFGQHQAWLHGYQTAALTVQ